MSYVNWPMEYLGVVYSGYRAHGVIALVPLSTAPRPIALVTGYNGQIYITRSYFIRSLEWLIMVTRVQKSHDHNQEL